MRNMRCAGKCQQSKIRKKEVRKPTNIYGNGKVSWGSKNMFFFSTNSINLFVYNIFKNFADMTIYRTEQQTQFYMQYNFCNMC